MRTHSAPRTKFSNPPPCFRIASASTAAGRSRGPALPCHIRDAPLYLPRRQRTRRTSCHAPVGATLAVARALHILLRFRRAGRPHPAVMVRVGNGGASRRRPLRNSIGKRSVGADAYIGPPRRISCNLSLRSQCAHWLWQSVLFPVLHSNGGISAIFAEKGL